MLALRSKVNAPGRHPFANITRHQHRRLEFGQSVPITPRRLAILGLLLGLPPLSALAARPFVTDDARIVDAGGCQIEMVVKKPRDFGEHEAWFLRGCNHSRRRRL